MDCSGCDGSSCFCDISGSIRLIVSDIKDVSGASDVSGVDVSGSVAVVATLSIPLPPDDDSDDECCPVCKKPWDAEVEELTDSASSSEPEVD